MSSEEALETKRNRNHRPTPGGAPWFIASSCLLLAMHGKENSLSEVQTISHCDIEGGLQAS